MPPSSGLSPLLLLPRQSRLQRVLAYRRLHICALAILVLDQLTKTWITHTMPLGTYGPPGHIEVIPSFLNLVHVGNTGAAWSILTGRGTLLSLLAMVALAAIYFLRHTIGLRRHAVQIAFGLLSGGILGNLVDRLARGHVVDFFDFHFGAYTYPAFNIADSGICVGVLTYVLLTLRPGRRA